MTVLDVAPGDQSTTHTLLWIILILLVIDLIATLYLVARLSPRRTIADRVQP